MKWIIKGTVFVVMLSLLSCGTPEDTTNTVPVPEPPEDTPADPYTPADPTTPDSRIPDLSLAVPISLADAVNYSSLEELATTLFLPIVGDPLVHIKISGGREQLVTGGILVAFEDREGFWGAELNSFEETGIRTSQYIDMIFADDELIIRTVSILNNDNLNGIIYYRLRGEDENECRQVITTCEPVTPLPINPYFPPWPPPECDIDIDVNAPCRAYMTINDSEVKELGTFKAKYSNWVVSE